MGREPYRIIVVEDPRQHRGGAPKIPHHHWLQRVILRLISPPARGPRKKRSNLTVLLSGPSPARRYWMGSNGGN